MQKVTYADVHKEILILYSDKKISRDFALAMISRRGAYEGEYHIMLRDVRQAAKLTGKKKRRTTKEKVTIEKIQDKS